MSDFQNQQESTVAPNEEVGVGSPTHSEQGQNVFVHQHIDRQLTYQDNRQYHNTTIYSLPEQRYVPSGGEGSKKGIEKLKKIIGKQYQPKYDVDLSNFAVSSEGFPEIYSEMYQVGFYQGMSIPDDNNYNPKSPGIRVTTSDRARTIDQLVSDIQNNTFVSVVGYPGSGKTTLSKRLARHLATRKDSLVLRKLFMDMNDCSEQLTLKELLLGDCNYTLTEDEKNSIFEWITINPENCFIILDGFDQVSWKLQENLKTSNYNTALQYWELLSNLCLEKLLRNCHLIFTSRPHAMLNIPQRCRPKLTYFIRDLTSENMKTLFDAFINNQQQSEVLWNKLTTKTPHLKSICYNPLMLQLYLRASLSSSHRIEDISSMTRIFHTVLLNLRASGHAVSLSDSIVIKLSKLAYESTQKGTVLITAEDLEIENLSNDKVQDLVVTLLGANRECGLLEGRQRLYFCHQTFQEYFSAFYICRQMSLKDFRSFVQSNLLNDHWSVVVQFLSGLLLDPYLNKDLPSSATTQLPSNKSTSIPMQSSPQPTSPSTQITSTSSSSAISQQLSNEPAATPTSFQQTPPAQPLRRAVSPTTSQLPSDGPDPTLLQSSTRRNTLPLNTMPQDAFLQESQLLNMPSNVSNQPQSSSQSASSSSLNSTHQTITRRMKSFLKKIFLKSSGRSSELSSQFQPLFQPVPNAMVQKKEIFTSVLFEKTQEVAASHIDDRSIIPLSKILRESCDKELVRMTGSRFDRGRIKMCDSDSQNNFHSVASFLKSMPGRIGILSLVGCGLNSVRFRLWIEAITSMQSSIVRMDLYGNLLSVDDIINVIHKVEEEVVVWRCIDDGRGGTRVPNGEECSRIQEALDRLKNKRLKIVVVFDKNVLKHKDAEVESSESDDEFSESDGNE